MPQHRRAGTGRCDDGLPACEHLCGVAHDGARRRPVSGIESRLTAAGLPGGQLDVAAEVFEHLDSRARDVVKERVAQAGGHQQHTLTGRSLANGRVEQRGPPLAGAAALAN